MDKQITTAVMVLVVKWNHQRWIWDGETSLQEGGNQQWMPELSHSTKASCVPTSCQAPGSQYQVKLSTSSLMIENTFTFSLKEGEYFQLVMKARKDTEHWGRE